MPRTISGTVACSNAVGRFLSVPSKKPADHWYTLCNGEKVDRRVCNDLLDGVVVSPRAVHAKHIRRLCRSDVRRGYGRVEMLRREDIAVLAPVGGSMVGMGFLKGLA